MLRQTVCVLRYRTAWRELLHPLPIHERHSQWLKRDTVEINEAVLRQPYYVIKNYAQPSFVDRTAMNGYAEDHRGDGASSCSAASVHDQTMHATLRAPRQATSPERLRELRDQLHIPPHAGPQPMNTHDETNRCVNADYASEYGSRLRPRYPQSWDTVPPHQPSRNPI